MPSPTVKESDFSKDIPVGNATINEVANIVSGPETNYILERLEQLGVNLNLQNVLLSTAKFSWGSKNPFKMFSKGDKSIIVTRPNAESITPFLKSLIAQQSYKTSDGQSKEYVSGIISSILSNIGDSSNQRVKKILKSIEQSSDQTVEFIKYFYSSSAFVSALKGSRLYYQAQSVLNDLIDIEALKNSKYSDPQVQEFANLISDGSISMEQMEKIQQQLGVTDPIAAIQELNNRIEYGPYFEISFLGKNEIVFKKAKRKPLLEMDAINSEYYGELVTPVATINGYNIVEYDGKYFFSDKILTTVEDLGSKPFNSINQIRGYIESILNKEGMSLTGYRNQVKQGVSTFESRRKDLNVGDRFVVTNVELGKYNNYPGNKILTPWKFGEFFDKMREHPLWKHVVKNLADEGIFIENILTSPEKVETFLALQDKLADMTRYRELYNRNSPRIDTKEKIEYSTDLARAALQEIQNAKEIVYEIVSKNGTKYKVERVQPEGEIPVFSKKTASFKQELVTISEYLQDTFGIKTNLVTSKDISNKFKNIIPNASRANAFIFENEIYINVDKATTADALHEYAHIVMGTIKQSRPELYYGLLERIEEHPMYSLKLEAFNGDKRARTDINEEIFVDIFGEYCARRMNPWFNDKTIQMEELKEKFRQGTQKVLQTGEDISSESVGKLLHMSIGDIMSEFGSTLSEPDPKAFNMDLAYQSRVVSNLITKLINSENPDTNIIETCE